MKNNNIKKRAGRPRKNFYNKREHFIKFRVDMHEKKKIIESAIFVKMSQSEFIRKSVLEKIETASNVFGILKASSQLNNLFEANKKELPTEFSRELGVAIENLKKAIYNKAK